VENHVIVAKEYITEDDKILIVDDFLAHGTALNGLIAIAEDAGAEVVGCAVAIEKGFQNGGDNLRARGYRIESLAIVEEINNEGVTFRV
jgi:xanthine phosphoribosyltransferase